jgi:hypothetical protein
VAIPSQRREAPGLPKIHAGPYGHLVRETGGRHRPELPVQGYAARDMRRGYRRENWEIASMNEHKIQDQVRRRGVRNPFGVMDVPDPEGDEVVAFAATVALDGSIEDDNASAWGSAGDRGPSNGIEGLWSSRWNGGADPTIPGDATDLWKQGAAELKTAGDLVYLLFDWADGARWGLIHARRSSDDRLMGRYINLTNPSVMRPWTGLIVSNRRIDGRWSGGRLDFRRPDPPNTDNRRS